MNVNSTIILVEKMSLEGRRQNSVQIAKSLLNESKYREYRIDVCEFLNGIGFKIYNYKNFKRNVISCISVSPDLKEKFGVDKIIVVNESKTISFIRAYIIQEFAYYLFEFDKNLELSYSHISKDGKSNPEYIDNFILEILMPEKLFMQHIDILKKTQISYYECVLKLCEFFSVHSALIVKRIEDLNVVF